MIFFIAYIRLMHILNWKIKWKSQNYVTRIASKTYKFLPPSFVTVPTQLNELYVMFI